MRSRPVAVVLATVAALVLSSSAFAAGPPAGKQAVIVVFAGQRRRIRPALAGKLTAAHGARPTFVYTHALKGFAATLPAAAVEALAIQPEGQPGRA